MEILEHFDTENYTKNFDIDQNISTIFIIWFLKPKFPSIPKTKNIPGGKNVLIPPSCILLWLIILSIIYKKKKKAKSENNALQCLIGVQ